MCITNSFETAYVRFIRNYLNVFSAKDVLSFFRAYGIRTSTSELEGCLENDPYSIPLEEKKYLTRAGAFSGQIFTFAPTAQEIKQGVIVAGDRCVPFADPKFFPCDFSFSFNNVILPQKSLKTNINNITEYFSLTEIEVVAQYLDADPVNAKLNIAKYDYELPYEFEMTGYDVSVLFKETDFKVGDRLVAFVSDWDHGIVEIIPLKLFFKQQNENIKNIDFAFLKNEWFAELEKYLLEGFERHGPCESIDAQLMRVFLENSRELCTPLCGSISEFLRWTDKIGIEYYGVERRLWRKGEEVPIEINSVVNSFYDTPDFVIDSFLKDELFQKKNLTDFELFEKIVPDSMDLTPKERDYFSLQIDERRARIRKSYNWFADFAFGAFRHRSLELYSEVRDLFFNFDCSEAELRKFPQSELVTLGQLFTHTSEILNMLDEFCESDESSDFISDEMDVAQSSIEGMELTFDDIRPILLDSYESIKKQRFSVVRRC